MEDHLDRARTRAERWANNQSRFDGTVVVRWTDGSLLIRRNADVARWIDPDGDQWLFVRTDRRVWAEPAENVSTVTRWERAGSPVILSETPEDIEKMASDLRNRWPKSHVEWTGFGWVVEFRLVSFYLWSDEGDWICDVHGSGVSKSGEPWKTAEAALREATKCASQVLRADLFDVAHD